MRYLHKYQNIKDIINLGTIKYCKCAKKCEHRGHYNVQRIINKPITSTISRKIALFLRKPKSLKNTNIGPISMYEIRKMKKREGKNKLNKYYVKNAFNNEFTYNQGKLKNLFNGGLTLLNLMKINYAKRKEIYNRGNIITTLVQLETNIITRRGPPLHRNLDFVRAAKYNLSLKYLKYLKYANAHNHILNYPAHFFCMKLYDLL